MKSISSSQFNNNNEARDFLRQNISLSSMHLALESEERALLLKLKKEHPHLYVKASKESLSSLSQSISAREELNTDGGIIKIPAVRQFIFEGIEAGKSVPGEEHITSIFGNNVDMLYSIETTGDSMVKAGIHHGDILIYRKCRAVPPSGTIVIASLEGVCFVKRLKYNSNIGITLCSENEGYASYTVPLHSNFLLFGEVTGIIRKIK